MVFDPRWVGARGDGSDDTAAINKAFATAAASGEPVGFSPGTYGVKDSGQGYCVLNPGVSFYGAGRDRTIIFPLPGTSPGADIMQVAPPIGGGAFISMSGVLIYPGYSGKILGSRGIYINCAGNCNLAGLRIHGMYIQASVGYGLEIYNDPGVNIQGNPSNSVIERSIIWDGLKLDSVGDSVTLRNNTFRGTPGSAHSGVMALMQAGAGGNSGHLVIEQCNFDCPGAAIWMLNGRNVKIRDCNIESSYGTGSSASAVIDLDGTSGALVMPEITGCHVAVFKDSTALSLIRVNGAVGASIDNCTLLAGKQIANGIALTNSCQQANIGFVEMQTANILLPVNNAGVNTRSTGTIFVGSL